MPLNKKAKPLFSLHVWLAMPDFIVSSDYGFLTFLPTWFPPFLFYNSILVTDYLTRPCSLWLLLIPSAPCDFCLFPQLPVTFAYSLSSLWLLLIPSAPCDFCLFPQLRGCRYIYNALEQLKVFSNTFYSKTIECITFSIKIHWKRFLL